MRKLIIPLVIFLFGFVFNIIGALFKIQHWPYGSLILTLGMLVEAFAVIVAIIVLLGSYFSKDK